MSISQPRNQSSSQSNTQSAGSKTTNNVVQKSCGYVFRMTVPEDLRPIIGKRELRYSLKERSLRHAKRKTKRISTKVKGLFSKLRNQRKEQKDQKGINSMALDKSQINRLIRNMIRTTIDEMEHEKAIGKTLTRGELNEYLNDLDLIEHDYRESLTLRDYRLIYPAVDRMVEEFNLDVKRDSPEYQRLAAEVLKAHIHLLQVDRQQSTGDYSYQFNGSGIATDESETTSESVSKIAQEYWNEKLPNWKTRTIPEYRNFRNTLMDFLGPDTMIHTVDYETGRAYKTYLDSIKNAKGQPLSDGRKDNYLRFAKQLWKWAVQHNYTDTNPFYGLQVGKSGRKRADEQREAFSQDDLRLMFCDSKEYGTRKGQDRITRTDYWFVPLLALFTGCRLEEICQAYVKDIKKDEGGWVLDVDADEPDKFVKTGERRLVPLHDFLIDLGFLDYVQNQPKKGRLFPNFRRINNLYAHAVGQWFSKFKKRIGIDSNKTFHSFRHTVATHLAEKDIPDHHISMLLGHSFEGQAKSRYIKRFKPKMLKEKVVDHIDYGIDLEHLKQSKFVRAEED